MLYEVITQVLDDGRLTDGHGRTVDFRNTVVVMTSNLGSQRIQALAGEGYEAMKEAVMDVVGQHFRPEFINRVDEMVVFAWSYFNEIAERCNELLNDGMRLILPLPEVRLVLHPTVSSDL